MSNISQTFLSGRISPLASRWSHLIEIILPRLDAPDPLVRFTKKAAEFDFPQLLVEEID